MKQPKIITIDKERFVEKEFTPCHNGVTDIYSLYKRPSYEKVQAFEYWRNRMCIYGMKGNSNCFSIYGYVIDEDGYEKDVKITRWNNYILRGRKF